MHLAILAWLQMANLELNTYLLHLRKMHTCLVWATVRTHTNMACSLHKQKDGHKLNYVIFHEFHVTNISCMHICNKTFAVTLQFTLSGCSFEFVYLSSHMKLRLHVHVCKCSISCMLTRVNNHLPRRSRHLAGETHPHKVF